MSQAKVDRNKEVKKNRKKIVRKEKMERRLTAIGGAILGIAIVGWAGFSVYQTATGAGETAQETQTIENYTVNMDALNSYMSSLNQD